MTEVWRKQTVASPGTIYLALVSRLRQCLDTKNKLQHFCRSRKAISAGPPEPCPLGERLRHLQTHEFIASGIPDDVPMILSIILSATYPSRAQARLWLRFQAQS
jgi:hypothetical protein